MGGKMGKQANFEITEVFGTVEKQKVTETVEKNIEKKE